MQQRKIADSGLSALLDRVVCIVSKHTDNLAHALGGRERRKSLVIGNSLRSDILPARSLEINAIHIDKEHGDMTR